jgi:ribosomal protein S18 acetylase RimI-like enzyme
VQDEAAVDAAVTNHRNWFERLAEASGGGVERFDGVLLTIAGDAAALPFPAGTGGLRAAVAHCRAHGLREVGCWAPGPDDELGRALGALGFQDGWQPHWMATRPHGAPAHASIEPGHGEGGPDLPYWSPRKRALVEAFPDDVVHLVFRRSGRVLGEVTVNLADGGAGLFDMGVAPDARRRGIGLALTRAACTVADERGCRIVTLNATADGEWVYKSAGFVSAGFGMTWWLFPRGG